MATAIDRFTSEEIIDKYEMDQPWAQMSELGESIESYCQFTSYLNLGPKRTIRGVYNIAKPRDRGNFSTWNNNYVKYQWRKRAQAYDEYQNALDQMVFIQERRDWRDRRRKILLGLDSVAQKALKKIKQKMKETDDNRDETLASLVRLLQTTLTESREEYGDIMSKAGVEANINFNQTNQKVEINVVEVIKDYDRSPEVVRGEFEAIDEKAV
jgi:hypothetical protein